MAQIQSLQDIKFKKQYRLTKAPNTVTLTLIQQVYFLYKHPSKTLTNYIIMYKHPSQPITA